MAAFIYTSDGLQYVQNLTIGQVTRVDIPTDGCGWILAVLAVIAFLLFIVLLL